MKEHQVNHAYFITLLILSVFSFWNFIENILGFLLVMFFIFSSLIFAEPKMMALDKIYESYLDKDKHLSVECDIIYYVSISLILLGYGNFFLASISFGLMVIDITLRQRAYRKYKNGENNADNK